MLPRSRAARFLAGLALVLLAVPLVLSTAWAKALVFDRAAAWARERYGLEVRADAFDYRLTALAVTLDGLAVADVSAPDLPFLRVEHVELDLAASALRGRLDIDRLRLVRPRLVLDAATRPRRGPTDPASGRREATPLPMFQVGVVEIEDLDLDVAAGEDDAVHVAVRQLTTTLRESGPHVLGGDVLVAGGLRVAVGGWDVEVGFDRAEARIALDGGRAVVSGALTAHSTVGTLRAEGVVPLEAAGDLDLRFAMAGDVAHLDRWWPGAPQWQGRGELSGTVSGSMRAPVAAFDARGRALGWASLGPATLDASGRIGPGALEIERLSLASPQGALEGRGRLAFDEAGESALSGRWTDVRAGPVSSALGLPAPPVAAVVSGAATLTWRGRQPAVRAVEGRVDASARITAPGTTTSGVATASGGGGRWRVGYRQSLNGAEARLESTVAIDEGDLTRSSVTGTLALHAEDARAAVDQLRRLGLPLPAAADVVGPAQVNFTGAVDGQLVSPRVRGELSAAGVRIGPAADLRVQGTMGIDRHGLEMSALTVESHGNQVVAEGTLPWRGAGGDGRFDARLTQFAALVPGSWDATGQLDLAGGWRGSAAAPDVSARIRGTHVGAAGLVFEALSAEVGLSDGLIRVADLEASQAEGVLAGSGSWNLAAATLTADVTARGLSMAVGTPGAIAAAPPRVHLAGLDVDAHAHGAPARLTAHATASAGRVEVDGRSLGAVRTAVDAADGLARISAEAPAHGAHLDAHLATAAPWRFDGRLAVERADLAGLARAAGVEARLTAGVTTSLDATLDASGSLRELGDARATLAVSRLDGLVHGRPLALAAPARARLDGGRLRVVDPARVTLGAATLVLAPASQEAPADAAVLTLEGSLGDLGAIAGDAVPSDLEVEGDVRATLRLDSRLDALNPTGDVTVDLTRLGRGGREWARDVRLLADGDVREVTVRELTGRVLESPVEGRGVLPVAWLRAALDRTPAGVAATFALRSEVAVQPLLAALLPTPPDVSGTVPVLIEGTASAPRLDALQATITDDGGELRLGSFVIARQVPTRLRLAQGRLLVDAFDWRGPRSEVVASGGLGLVDGTDGRLRLHGDASLAALSLLAPGRVDGRGRFDLEVSGPPGRRDLLGTITVDDGSLIVPAWRLALADWSGRLVFEPDGVAVRGVRGQFNGGEATIEGRLPIGRAPAADDGVAVTVRGAFLDVPRGLRSQLDAALEWRVAAGTARLTGDATITASAYREPVTELLRLASVLIDQSGGGPAAALAPALAATGLDVRIATMGPLAVANSALRVELQPDLRLIGTLGRPALSGQVALQDDGRIQVGGRQYRLRDSRVEFSRERGLVPWLDVNGETRVGDYTVNLRLSGPATEIETSLSSSPPLGERDLQSLLVTGQRESPSGRTTSEQAAVGVASGDVLGLAGQYLGFDSVVVGTTDDLSLVSSDVDPALRLTVSKRVGTRFELVLSDNLDDNELTWVLIYRPRPGFELRAVSRGGSEYTGEFRQEIAFGPGASAPRATAARAAARDRVGAVTLSGEPGFAAPEVLAVTTLRRGDRFDFARWLEDRERIGRLYVERGYYSARVVPTRRPEPGAGDEPVVALDYRITRGPQTELSVSGYAPPPAVLDQLRRAWADSALPQLLDGALAGVMREHLVARGYLRAAVTVSVHASPARVTARVDVAPGPLTTARRLDFSGNTAIGDDALLAAARAAGAADAAWTDPAPLVEAVESAYSVRGYLAATVAPGAVVFDGDAATLPFAIVEGPQARVASLVLAGADGMSEAEAAEIAGLSVGALYTADTATAARLALQRHYRGLGYRDADVESRVAVDAGAGRADVSLTVRAGPRYVVRSVRTNGVESTREALVDRATRLEPGSPASPQAAEAARRRLYDIGTFRSADVTFEPVAAAGVAAAGDTVPVDAVVSLQESRRFLFLYGVEATNQYQSLFDTRVTSAGVAADLRDRNFLGRGWTLGAGLRVEPSFKSVRVLTAVPRLGSRRIRTNLYADTRTEDRFASDQVTFTDDETSLTIEQRWRVRAPVEISWGYSYDFRDIRFLEAGSDQTLLRFKGNLAGLAGAVVVDRRDNLFDATRGWLASMSTEWGLQPLGSDLGYVRALARASFYRPLGPLTLAANARWGSLTATGGRPPLTVLDLFFDAGGTQTVRGYEQDSLSAYQLLGSPVGGTSLLVFNQELRFPLFWKIGGVAFADAGNTFTEERGIVLGDLAVGLGVGLRIRTPLAPVRLDVGFPINRQTGMPAFRWHFSIGQMF